MDNSVIATTPDLTISENSFLFSHLFSLFALYFFFQCCRKFKLLYFIILAIVVMLLTKPSNGSKSMFKRYLSPPISAKFEFPTASGIFPSLMFCSHTCLEHPNCFGYTYDPKRSTCGLAKSCVNYWNPNQAWPDGTSAYYGVEANKSLALRK